MHDTAQQRPYPEGEETPYGRMPERNKTHQPRDSSGNHLDDGGEALGRLGVQIIGGHKPNPYPASPMPPQWLRVTQLPRSSICHRGVE